MFLNKGLSFKNMIFLETFYFEWQGQFSVIIFDQHRIKSNYSVQNL